MNTYTYSKHTGTRVEYVHVRINVSVVIAQIIVVQLGVYELEAWNLLVRISEVLQYPLYNATNRHVTTGEWLRVGGGSGEVGGGAVRGQLDRF